MKSQIEGAMKNMSDLGIEAATSRGSVAGIDVGSVFQRIGNLIGDQANYAVEQYGTHSRTAGPPNLEYNDCIMTTARLSFGASIIDLGSLGTQDGPTGIDSRFLSGSRHVEAGALRLLDAIRYDGNGDDHLSYTDPSGYGKIGGTGGNHAGFYRSFEISPMMKLILKMGIGIVLLLSIVTGVAAQNSLLLTGRTTNVQIAEDKDNIVLTVSLDLTIKNESESNIILFWDKVAVVGHLISQSADPMRPNVLFRGSALPSTNRSPFWNDLQKQLDTTSPPPDLTRTLRSGESINLSRSTTMSIYKKDFYPAQWSEILASSPVWLKVILDMLPSNLDRTSLSQKSFGKKLKKKWASFGILQTDLLQSAPIKLDLNNL